MEGHSASDRPLGQPCGRTAVCGAVGERSHLPMGTIMGIFVRIDPSLVVDRDLWLILAAATLRHRALEELTHLLLYVDLSCKAFLSLEQMAQTQSFSEKLP